jgi:hypothetical protein
MTIQRARSIGTSARLQILGQLDGVHTAIPAVVTGYDAKTQRVSVKPLVKHGYYDQTDVRMLESFGIEQNIPVLFPGGGGQRLTFPISDGTLIDLLTLDLVPATKGYLIASEESLDAWLAGTGDEVDPVHDHRFDLSSSVFLPGLMTFGAPWGNVPTDHGTLGPDGGVLIHSYGDHVAVATAVMEALAKSGQTTVRGAEFMIDLAAVLSNLVIVLPLLAAVGAVLAIAPQLSAIAALIDPAAPDPGSGSLVTMAAKALAPPATAPGTYQSPNLLVP